MGTNYIAPIWRMPRNANKDNFSNYSIKSAVVSIMNIDNPTQVGITSSFSFWLKRPTKTSATRIYNVGTNVAYGWYMYQGGSFIRYNGNYLWPKDDPIGTLPEFRTATEIEDEWVHWVITRKEVSATAQNIRIYANGALVYSVDNATVLGTSDSTLSSFFPQSSNTRDENLSSFAVYDYELQLSQVQQIYNNGMPLNEMALSYGDPVSYYLFGDNANLNAGSGGVAMPNISVRADSVFQFDRSSIEYVKIDPPALNFTDKMSFSAWAKFTSTAQDVYTVAANFDPNSGYKFQMGYYRSNTGSGSLVRVQLAPANSNIPQNFEVPVSQLDINKFYHLAFSFDGTTNANGFNIYIDNTKYSFTANNPGINSNTTNGTRIGNYQNGNTWAMIGEISNVQFWDTNLQDSDIDTLYNNGQPLMTGTQPQENNLRGWYKLNQTANWEADSTGNWQIPNAVSSYPQSFNFNGSSDYIEISKDDALGLVDTDFSISIWLSPYISHNGLVMMNYDGSGGWGVYYNSGNIRFYDTPTWTTLTNIPAGKWSHILIVGDNTGNNLICYRNGIQVFNSSKTLTITETTRDTFIGSEAGTNFYFNGKLSNIALWNSNQSSEKDNIYNNGVPATSYTNNPVVWYKLDNTSIWNPAPANYWTFLNAADENNSGVLNFSN